MSCELFRKAHQYETLINMPLLILLSSPSKAWQGPYRCIRWRRE